MSIFTPIEIRGVKRSKRDRFSPRLTVYKKHGTVEDVLAFLEGHNKAMLEVEPHAETFDIDYWRVLLEELGQREFDMNNIYIYEDGYYDFDDRGNSIVINIPFAICNENCGCYLEIRFKNFNVCEFDKMSNYYSFVLIESMNDNWIQECDDFIGEFPLESKVVADKIERRIIEEIKTQMAVVLMSAASQVFTNYKYYDAHREEMYELGEYLESLFSDSLVQRFIDLTIHMKEDEE